MIGVNFDLDTVMAQLDHAQDKLKEFAVEFIQDMNQEVVENTPYKTGNLRGSWYAALNDMPNAANGPPDAGGGAVARLNLTVADIKLGDVYYAVNGANYAVFVEYGTVHMEGRFFVQNTVGNAPSIAAATLARIAET